MDEHSQIKHILTFGITFSVPPNLSNLYKLDSESDSEYMKTCWELRSRSSVNGYWKPEYSSENCT